MSGGQVHPVGCLMYVSVGCVGDEADSYLICFVSNLYLFIYLFHNVIVPGVIPPTSAL